MHPSIVRSSENEHMAEFEEVGACVGVHFVQTSLDLLPERQDWYCARNLVLRRPVVVIILAGGQGTVEKAAGFLPPFVSGGLCITRCGHAVGTLLRVRTPRTNSEVAREDATHQL